MRSGSTFIVPNHTAPQLLLLHIQNHHHLNNAFRGSHLKQLPTSQGTEYKVCRVLLVNTQGIEPNDPNVHDYNVDKILNYYDNFSPEIGYYKTDVCLYCVQTYSCKTIQEVPYFFQS